MNIRSADTTGMDLDVYIVISKWLGLKLILMEFGPGLGIGYLKAGESLWVWHYGFSSNLV